MKKLLGFAYDTALGQLASVLAIIATVIGVFAYDQRGIGERNAIHEINASATELAKAAEQARADADRPGAAGRLLKHSCRDC